MTGYDLKKKTEANLAFFWSESYGQIYPILHKMEKDGLVTMVEDREEGRPPKKIYSITDIGKESLLLWMKKKPDKDVFRSELLLKLFFSQCCGPEIIKKHIQERMDDSRAKLREYDEMMARMALNRNDDPAFSYWTMAVEFGINSELASIDWCKQTLNNLESFEKKE